MINKEITKMKKFIKIIAAVMAAATIAVTTSVCASAIRLTTGEEVTEEVIDRYATLFKELKLNPTSLIIVSNDMGFFDTNEKGITGSAEEYEGANIDYWATLQKSKLRQRSEGFTSILDPFSRG